MHRKIICILVYIMLIATMVIVHVNSNVKANPEDEGGTVGLDYDFIYSVVENLSYIIKDPIYGKDHEIWKGRYFGTVGERHAKDLVYDWIFANSDNLTTDITVERIGDESYLNPLHIMKRVNNKIVITDYSIALRNATSGPPNTNIAKNESFPFPQFKFRPNLEEYTVDTDGYSKVFWPPIDGTNNPLGTSEVDFSTFNHTVTRYNVSYTLLNASNTIVYGNVTYIEDLIIAPASEKEYKVHLINVTDDDYNDTVKDLENANASGFILMRDNVSNIKNWSINISGVAISEENGSLLKNLTQNGSVLVVPPGGFIPPENGILTVYHIEDCDSAIDKIYLVNATYFSFNYYQAITTIAILSLCPRTAGFIICDSIHPQSHFMYPYANVNLSSIIGSYSSLLKPMMSINGSIVVDGAMKDVFEWVEENYGGIHTVRSSFSITQKNNNEVESYNIYCDVQGKNPDKTVYLSAGHYEAWWGQLAGDDATGVAVMLGILKYLNDNQITPKYNVRFIFHSGHENTGKGGASHVNNETSNNIDLLLNNASYIINVDMFAHKFNNSTFRINVSDGNLISVISAIVSDANYNKTFQANNCEARIGHKHENGTVDCKWYTPTYNDHGINLTYVNIGKDSNPMYHQTGFDHSIGDTIDSIDRFELNFTSNIIWNISKYLIVDPNCWFSNVTYEAIDLPDDGDSLPDSIRANFTINTVLPHDLVMVKVIRTVHGNPMGQGVYKTVNYTVTSAGRTEELVFSIPDTVTKGNYSLFLRLYNSTGRINRIVGGGDIGNINDTSDSSNIFQLYHPFGYTKVGATSKSVEDRITGSVFTTNEYGTADNITAFINRAFMSPGPYKCMIFRANDSKLIGTTIEDWYALPGGNPESSSGWAIFNFTGDKPVLEEGIQYILTCWGNNTYSRLYYNDFEYERGRYFNLTYNSTMWPDPMNFINESRLYSIYCSYTPDTTPPEITNVSDTPDTVGFGQTITISADVTDSESGVGTVMVNVSYPDDSFGNYTMNHTSGSTYEYVFSDNWLVGRYNYSIWAEDYSVDGNLNSSSGYSFNVSAQATISVATIKDSYGDNETVNLTDPPSGGGDGDGEGASQPSGYQIIERGLTWNKYRKPGSGYKITSSMRPLNYYEDNIWKPIDCNIYLLNSSHLAYQYGYRSGNTHGLYNLFLKPNSTDSWPIAFAYNKSNDPLINVLRSKLVSVGYYDPTHSHDYEILQNVQNSQGERDGSNAIYPNVFTGVNATWRYGSVGVKEDLTLSNQTREVLINNPPSDFGLSNQDSYIVFATKLDYRGIYPYVGGVNQTGNFTVENTSISFRDAMNRLRFTFPLGKVYEQSNESNFTQVTFRMLQYNDNYYLLAGIKVVDLYNMQFPVIFDPSLNQEITASTDDAHEEDLAPPTFSNSADICKIGGGSVVNEYWDSWFRFDNVPIPANSTISSAHLYGHMKKAFSIISPLPWHHYEIYFYMGLIPRSSYSDPFF